MAKKVFAVYLAKEDVPNSEAYHVTDVSKVSETDRSGLADSGENMLTLYTCVRNQRDQRWCVTAVEA